MTRITKKKITTLGLIGGLLAASYVSIKYVFPLLWPFVVAYGIAVIIHPIVKFLVDKLHFHKNAATILTMCFTLIGIGVFLFFVGNGIIIQSARLIEKWPYYEKQLMESVENICEGIENFFNMNSGTIYDTVYDGAANAMESWQKSVMPTIMNNSIKTIMTLVNLVIVLFLTIMSIFYMTRDMEKYKRVSEGNIFFKEIRYIKSLALRIIKAYVRSQFIIILVVAVVCSLGLLIIGNDYYILFGVIIGILDALPLIGVGAVMIPWSIIYVFMGNYYKAAILMIVFVLCYFIREYLEPRLMGKQIGITPIASLISIYVGYRLFGFLGMIVGPLMYVLIREVVGKYVEGDEYR